MLSFDNLVISRATATRSTRLTETDETRLSAAGLGRRSCLLDTPRPITSPAMRVLPGEPGHGQRDRREIGPTYFFAPPRVFETLLTR
jgi:long-chain acyl-CoA synthetase